MSLSKLIDHDTPIILIVDDTPSNLSVVVNLFEEHGYRVSIAQDGEEGLQRAQLVQPNLILLDVMMPGIDGFETCRRLKAQESTRDIPVIFMTALAATEHKVNGFDVGGVDYVTKPLQIDEVMARVDTHLKLHTAQKRLEEQNAQLDRHREELEQRVAERTAELNVSNLQLRAEIEERIWAQAQLAAREREFRTLAESLPDNLARYDKLGRIIYMNPRLERLLGKSLVERLGTSPLESSPGPLFAEYQARLTETIRSGQPSEMELVLPDTGEGIHYHYIRFVAECDAQGEIVGALAIGRDITERKQAERELHLLNRAVNASTEAAFLMNAQGCFVYVNEEACRSLGYSREELLTMTPIDIDPDISVEFFGGLLDSIFADGPSKPLESRHRARDGRTFPIEIVASPLKLEGENYCLAMVRDITERKRAESALRESEQRYREIFDNAIEGMYLLEVTDDGRFRNIDINPALAASTGIPREAMIGRFVDDVVPEDAGRLIVEKYRRCVAAGATITENIELALPAGNRYYISTITPIYYAGRVHRLIGISRDITDLKKAERELEESRAQLRGLTARREEAREEERKYIAREVHDELGQILTGLQLNVSVLTHKFAADSQPLRDQLRETMMLTEKALGVARNVASALRPASLDMGIASALEWLAGRFGSNTGIRCEVHVGDMEIELDESHAIAVFRIVQESLTNVARHAKADKVDIVLGRLGDDYLLKIRDNGKGFDNQEIKNDSFGLVGMRERALLLGGKVIINSSPGTGTEVEVHIPRT